jgi:hypothetical protein
LPPKVWSDAELFGPIGDIGCDFRINLFRVTLDQIEDLLRRLGARQLENPRSNADEFSDELVGAILRLQQRRGLRGNLRQRKLLRVPL